MNSVLLASPICMAVTRWQDPRCKSIEVSHNCLGPWSRWLDSLVMLFQSLAITSHLTFFWWQSLELLQWQLLESCRRTLWASPVWCYVCSSFNCSSRQRTYWQKQSMQRRCNRNQKKDLHWCRMFGLAFRWAAFVPLSWIWAAKRSISIEFLLLWYHKMLRRHPVFRLPWFFLKHTSEHLWVSRGLDPSLPALAQNCPSWWLWYPQALSWCQFCEALCKNDNCLGRRSRLPEQPFYDKRKHVSCVSSCLQPR